MNLYLVCRLDKMKKKNLIFIPSPYLITANMLDTNQENYSMKEFLERKNSFILCKSVNEFLERTDKCNFFIGDRSSIRNAVYSYLSRYLE